MSGLAASGIDWHPILHIFVSNIPAALAFTIPIGVLTATLLVFGRLSADSEIVAIKACGISLWQVVRWMLPTITLLTVICIYINSNAVPNSHFARRSAMVTIKSGNPIDLVQECRPIKAFDGLTIYVGKKTKDQIKEIRIYDMRQAGQKREIKAESGTIEIMPESDDILLKLRGVMIDPISFDHPGAAHADKWSILIENKQRRKNYTKRVKDMSLGELFNKIRTMKPDEAEDLHAFAVGRMKMAVEMNKRLVLSCSCLAFMFIGIPFGIRSHRKESSIGIGLSLGLVFFFYLFVLMAEQLVDKPQLHPDMLVWLPVLVAVVLGGIMIHRIR
jgi:lipopolysaccharide export system permease protein